MYNRRQFIRTLAGSALVSDLGTVINYAAPAASTESKRRSFTTRGVVLVPEDLSLVDWPERAQQAKLTTIALHHGQWPQEVVKVIQSDRGQQFLEKCRQLKLNVEYELHAMAELLPRSLFAKDKTLFRMNDQGERVGDANLCVHSSKALNHVAENALRLAQWLRPSTSRYFFWGDDGQPWCRCASCRAYSDSEQALILENHLLTILRQHDPKAQLAHLAYANTIRPPLQIKPHPGIFLEYAPIHRRYDIPYVQQTSADDQDGLSVLDANLKVFPPQTAQVLEYWLDVSRFSHWTRPGVKLPWNRTVFLADIEAYASRGIHHITTFTAWVDAEYVQHHRDLSFIQEYGTGLAQ